MDLLLSYVDNIILACNDGRHIAALEMKLCKHFETSFLGEVIPRYYGFDIHEFDVFALPTEFDS